MAIRWTEASDEQEHWLMHWGSRWLKSDKTCTHTGQYAGGVTVSSDYGQRQALVEPLSLLGVTWNVNKFLCKTAQEGGSGLAIHTSGYWFRLQLVESSNCREGHCISSICRSQHQLLHCLVQQHRLCYVVSDFLQRYPQRSRPIQGSCPCSKGSGSNHQVFYPLVNVKPTGQRGAPGQGETNKGQWPLEDRVDGWMSGEAARILNAGQAMKPQPVNKLTTAAFRAFENIGTGSDQSYVSRQ